ncbi:hypothetical protein Q757_01420 [Oenococcus alcoholitolerans]|uniref:Uncharacterized protein n=1 Tax=Oenococcus alcoholitolerans TaxID=931074 RepID=A0ABR4XSW9_9LACO|nr:hypothetical protein Q757_01420 [Oenococcus alcoholitolerans]
MAIDNNKSDEGNFDADLGSRKLLVDEKQILSV